MLAASFAILGIGPTNDQKSIRRAYAAALKRIDQAADPEGFAALRGAYEHVRAWAERQLEGDAEPDHWLAGNERPPASPVQVRPDINPPPRPAAPETSSLDAPPDGEQERAGYEPARGQAPQERSTEAPETDRRADPPLRSREDLDEGVAYWTHRLMHTPDADLAQSLAVALADERLGHLEAREVLAHSLARALREQSDGRLALFNTARRAFDWNGLNAPVPHDPALSGWVRMVLDQIERYSHLPLPLRVRLDAVVMLARRRSAPNPVQAFWNGQNFELLLQHAPDLAVLDLGQDRIRTWREKARRFARAWDWLRWLSVHWAKLAIAAFCLVGLVSMFQDFRGGTTYKIEQPSRASLVDGRVTLQAQRVAANPEPCAQRGMQAPPLGCPTLGVGHTAPDLWPTATPKIPVITAQPTLLYPKDARVRTVKNTVWVRVMLDAQGKVLRKAVMFSSGNRTLDQAAVDAAGSVRMMPALQDDIAVPGQSVLVFDYQLEAP
ncbi:Gram-negative bacterial tonB protein [compost metagenome]